MSIDRAFTDAKKLVQGQSKQNTLKALLRLSWRHINILGTCEFYKFLVGVPNRRSFHSFFKNCKTNDQ